MQEYVTLAELAQEWGLDRSNTRKYVLKEGFVPFRVRTEAARNQPTLALSPEDAEAIRDRRRQQGFTAMGGIVESGPGVFYVVQLIPELDPLRVKLGYTDGIDGRLAAHRTASPTAQLVKVWPCQRTWEPAAMASISKDCRLIGNEVYQCESLEALTARGDAFFALLP